MNEHAGGRSRVRRVRTVALGIGIGLGATMLSGIAFAVWTVDGSGSVSDKAATLQALKVIAAPDPTADLYPGKTGAAQFTVQNDNPFAVTVTQLTFGAVTTSNPQCPGSNLTPVSPTATVSLAVAANSTSAPQQVANALRLSPDAPNACQGVTFTVAVTATATQQ